LATVPVVSLACGMTWLVAVFALRHPLQDELQRLLQPIGRALQRR
jgi:uncharacterized protein YhhL (DUF1145 family)